MHTTTTDRLEAEAERTAGILEDRHAEATTPALMFRDAITADTQARALAKRVVAAFTADNPGHWQRVASSLTDTPEMLDSFATQHGLPRPTNAVKATCIAYVRSQGLAAAMSPIPPASERPVCVTVGWLAEHPGFAAQLEYLDGENGWKPAADAVRGIDPCWPVEIRQAMHVVAG